MSKRGAAILKRHPGWVKVQATLTFLVVGSVKPEEVEADLKMALDPGGEEDNIFEPLVPDDFFVSMSSQREFSVKHRRRNSVYRPLYEKSTLPLATAEDVKIFQASVSFPTSKGVASNLDTLDVLFREYVESRATESNYLINGYTSKVYKAGEY